MRLVMVGLSHHSAPVEVREGLAFPSAHALARALAFVKNALGPGAECVLLSTCNRSELYVALGAAQDASGGGRAEDLPALLVAAAHSAKTDSAAGAAADLAAFLPHLIERRGHKTAEHLFRVAAGLDSMILGEPDIVRQVKSAYGAASEAGTVGPTLNPLFHRALSVAKRVRTETGLGRGAFSVGHAAGALAQNIFGQLAGRTVLLLGAGEMSEATARHLHAAGATSVLVANRTFDRAVRLAETLNGRAIQYNEFPAYLQKADIVIASTAAPHPVVNRTLVKSVLRARRHRPLFLIDIAVPRDIEPDVGDLPDVFLYNIDDLRQVVETEEAERRGEAARAEAIVQSESLAFARWLQTTRQAAPLVSGVRAKHRAIVENELGRLRERLPHLAESDWRLIETTLASIENKIAHAPTAKIKEYASDASPESEAKMDTVRELFDLPVPDSRGSGVPMTIEPEEVRA